MFFIRNGGVATCHFIFGWNFECWEWRLGYTFYMVNFGFYIGILK